jgi:hypothetical protein
VGVARKTRSRPTGSSELDYNYRIRVERGEGGRGGRGEERRKGGNFDA